MSADDLSRPAAARPRSIELPTDSELGMFPDGQAIGDKFAFCDELCRRLLFNGEVDWVRVKRAPAMQMGRLGGESRSATYHLEHRDPCPQVYSEGARIENVVRDRLLAGDCLIVEVGGDAAPEAVVKLTTRYSDQHDPSAPPPDRPSLVNVKTIKDLEIRSLADGKLSPVRRQTEIVTYPLAQPFYVGAKLDIQRNDSRATIGRYELVTKPIDLTRALRETFGYVLTEISHPPPEDARKVAERILALSPDASSTFSAAQQDMLGGVVSALATQSGFSDADVEFMRRVIADRRVTHVGVGLAIDRMFRRDP